MTTIVIAVTNGARRSALSLVLHGAGHAVEAVGDADALIEAVQRRRPDILLLDPGLTMLGTVEPLRRLRESGHLQQVRLVLVDDPFAPPQGWSSVAKQLAAGVLADIGKDSILRAVAAAEGLLPGGGAVAAPAPPGPPPRRGSDPTGSFRAFNPPPPNPSKTGAFRAFPAPSPAPAPPAPPEAAPPGPPLPPGVPARPRILVVEDSPTVRALTGIAIEAAGWEVAWAGSSEEAMGLLGTGVFVALLADINLPGMSGDELAVIARKSQPGLRCMLMTARPRSRWPRMPDDIPIFPKPLDMDLLVRELGSIRMMLEG